jgi:hypothetical protein
LNISRQAIMPLSIDRDRDRFLFWSLLRVRL